MSDPNEIADHAAATLNREFGELERRLRVDGRQDRADMGKPDPTLAEAFANLTKGFARIGELFRVKP